MKMFIARISYTDYVIEQGDAVELLAIAARARVVKQEGYSGPYYVQPDREPFVDMVSLQEVEFPENEVPKVDKYTSATREVPF